MLAELLARVIRPRSWCSGCGRPWFSDNRRPCNRCGSNARRFDWMPRDGVTVDDRLK
jgi:rRNA maturation endonuclease Nob1